MVSINTNQEQQYKKPCVGAIVGGVIAGTAVQNLTNMSSQLVSSKIIERINKVNSGLSKDEFLLVENAVKETVKSSGLADKGVSIIKTTAENADEISQIMMREADKGIPKYLPRKLKEFIGRKFSSEMVSGENACYAFASKKIVMPEKELCLAMFHETGHAMNVNLSNIGKILQKCRSLSLLTLPISLIALWKTQKAPGEKSQGEID